MRTKEDFLAQILANPDDDAPRLVFADWLDEQGESERAEFIRVQCELACTEMSDNLPRRQPERGKVARQVWRIAQLRHREQLYLATRRWEWIAPKVRHVKEPVFRRGLVAEITCPADDWKEHGAELLREHPLEKLTLTEVRDWTIGREFERTGKGTLRQLELVCDESEFTYVYDELMRFEQTITNKLHLQARLTITGSEIFSPTGNLTPPDPAAHG